MYVDAKNPLCGLKDIVANASPTQTVQEEEAPSGMLARGHYNANSSFVDDDKKKHLQFEWSFDIAKEW